MNAITVKSTAYTTTSVSPPPPPPISWSGTLITISGTYLLEPGKQEMWLRFLFTSHKLQMVRSVSQDMFFTFHVTFYFKAVFFVNTN